MTGTTFGISFLIFITLNATETLTPKHQLEIKGELSQSVMSPDGSHLFAVIKNGNHCDLVAWNLIHKSRDVLIKNSDCILITSSPQLKSLVSSDSKYLFAYILNKSQDQYKIAVDVWNVDTYSRTNLFVNIEKQLVSFDASLSRDGRLIAIPDMPNERVHVRVRNEAGSWQGDSAIRLSKLESQQKAFAMLTTLSADQNALFALRCIPNKEKDGGFNWYIDKCDLNRKHATLVLKQAFAECYFRPEF